MFVEKFSTRDEFRDIFDVFFGPSIARVEKKSKIFRQTQGKVNGQACSNIIGRQQCNFLSILLPAVAGSNEKSLILKRA